MAIGKLHSIETFGALDGPGIRTVFFCRVVPHGVCIVTILIPGTKMKESRSQSEKWSAEPEEADRIMEKTVESPFQEENRCCRQTS